MEPTPSASMAATSLSGLRSALYDTATSVSPMPALAPPTSLAPLEFVVPFCTNAELACVSLLDREHERICEHEWRLRVLRRYGTLRYDTRAWRKCFKLRAHLEQKAVDTVTARVYLMNGRGETQCFTLPRGKSLMCSRERAVVYNRCERMFDLSLRINRSIQEISALIGMISVDEARGLLNEHINLMASVASLRGSLLFESELFQVFPAPVLLDANSLLRGTFSFPDASFLQSSTLMMQVWASIDGLIYRPLSPPVVIEHCVDVIEENGGEDNRAAGAQVEATDENAAAEAAVTASEYHSVKLHDLSGMTIHIDDNTLRYKLQKNEICINALVSNTYLLYLFNPLNFRPLDWTFEAVVHVDAMRYVLPVQREGVFLNTTSFALRVFLSYGKIPEKEQQQDDGENGANTKGGSRSRGAETSEPLKIPYTCGVSIDDSQILSFCLTATNRITKETREIASKSACISVTGSPEEEDAAPVAPTEFVEPPMSDEAQVEMASEKENAMQVDDRDEDQDLGNMDTRTSLASPRTTTTKTPAGPTERHVHLPRVDAMICYSFSPSRHLLQYVEFAIGFEPLMHQLGVSSFLPDAVPVSA